MAERHVGRVVTGRRFGVERERERETERERERVCVSESDFHVTVRGVTESRNKKYNSRP